MADLSELFAGGLVGQHVTGVTVDSRLVKAGDLFVALAGDERFIPVRVAPRTVTTVADALARGALRPWSVDLKT